MLNEVKELTKLLMKSYLLDDNFNISEAIGGHDGKNFIVETPGEKYFLKQYRDPPDRVEQIHKTYKYFEKNGIPIISPLNASNGKDFIELDDNVYALFPFYKGVELLREDLTLMHVSSMGELLGKMHTVAELNPPKFSIFEKTRKFDINYFNNEASFLLKHINNIANKNILDEKNIETLESQINFINKYKDEIEEIDKLDKIILTHRDFHERNMFFNTFGEVEKIFDFDKACLDSKYIEISRTILFVCTAGHFNEANFKKIEALLLGYLKHSSINHRSLRRALRFYIFDDAKSRWVMEQYYLKGNKRTEYFMQDKYNTQKYMSENLDYFVDRVLSNIQ